MLWEEQIKTWSSHLLLIILFLLYILGTLLVALDYALKLLSINCLPSIDTLSFMHFVDLLLLLTSLTLNLVALPLIADFAEFKDYTTSLNFTGLFFIDLFAVL